MNRWLKIGIAIIAALVIVSFAKDMIIKVSVEKGVSMVTGLRLTTGAFRVGILRTLVDIRDLKIFNPAGFKDRTMLDMPEIYVAYDLGAIFAGTVHLTEARLALKEFVVVKNEKGVLNLDALKVVKAEKDGKAPAAEKAAGKAPAIQIDTLRLKIGKAIYKDYSAGPEPVVKEYVINLDETYRDIRDPYALVSLIVVKSLMNTSIANMAGFDLKGLQGTVSGTLAGAQKGATAAVAKTQAAAETGVKTATEAAKKTTEAFSGFLGNPLGSDNK